jgi:hypothetical protein
MPRKVVPKALKVVLALLGTTILSSSQTPSNINQKAKNSTCSNIVALAGNVNVKYSSLTPAQKKLIESIPALLNKIISNQLDPNLLMKKIDEMEASVKEIHEQQEFSGLLLPANDPTPENACSDVPFPIRSDAMLIILGNSASFNSASPHTVLKVRGEDMIILTKKDNAIAVNVKIFGRDRRIVAEIKDNEFSINPNNYFRKEQPDKSTLIVYDQYASKVLDVRFMNSSTIRFLGVLNYPDSNGPLVISQTEGVFANRICGYNNTVDFAIK